jgi:alanyl-tRNA synthetase
VEAADFDLNQLRQRYLRFFVDRAHLHLPSAPVKSDDPSLMFTSAGMVPFKPYFLGATPKFAGYEGVHHRVTTSQKCLRINDIENVGRTLRHHSFFEMLGNFSFGDYFKREAAAWAWEFLTSPEWMGLDPERLYVTIYLDDDEAFEVWTEHVGVPAERVSRWDEDENFWPASAISQGPNGPCGPCSEIFYDRGPAYGTPDEVGPNTGSGDRYIEVWNLVFTQFDRRDGGELVPLPQKNIDTGLGFERLSAIMSGGEDAYATALFQPTIRRVAELSGSPYLGTESISHRVIADHLRAVTFSIGDGVLPANDGAGYIVKMLIRRASRHAWLLGLREPVLHTLIGAVVEAMGAAYPDLAAAGERVAGIVRTEEEQFLRTLEAGIARTERLLSELDGATLPGDVAFDLWETHGFPLDITREMAAERGVEVDAEGYEAARERARDIARAGRGGGELFRAGKDLLGAVAEQHGETHFGGYGALEGEGTVLALIHDDALVEALDEGQSGRAILDATPFYPEGGGQIGDSGKLSWPDGSALVSDSQRSSQGLIVHQVRVARGRLTPGMPVAAAVDPARRETEKHHSATHLLHAALRQVLGTHVAQAGSLVAPDRLRFDFSHPQAVGADEVAEIERRVNRWIQADLAVDWREVPLDEARSAGAMMLFGEKYGDRVRMVTVGDAGDGEAVSIELCGGTHVARSGQIGSLVIVAEEAVSAGVRRVTALVGMAALAYLQELRATTTSLGQRLGAKADGLIERVERLQDDLKGRDRDLAALRDKLAAAQTAGASDGDSGEANGFTWATRVLDGLDASALRNAADTLLGRSGADIVVLASGTQLVAKVGEGARERGAHAGNLIREVAKRAGGGGGGRPDLAQAGVKDAARIPEALGALPEILSSP